MTPIEIFAGVFAMTAVVTASVWALMQIPRTEYPARRPAFSVLREAEAKRACRIESVIQDRELLSELAKRVELAERRIEDLKKQIDSKPGSMKHGNYATTDFYTERESKAWPIPVPDPR